MSKPNEYEYKYVGIVTGRITGGTNIQSLDKKARDKEQEHRDRVNRYYRKNVKAIRTRKRNAYRLKHGIPLDKPVKKSNRALL